MGKPRLAATAAAAALAVAAAPRGAAWPLETVRVDPVTGHFVDTHGRTRIFHGVNVVYKEAPWYPRSDRFTATDSLDPSTMEKLREWGFNVVRLGVMWPGVEPQLGTVDLGYLAAMDNLTQGLADHGVYTIVDLHQDVGSRRFCGEGFPEHYVEALLRDPGSRLAKAAAFPAPALGPTALRQNASGFPELEDCLRHNFANYYVTHQVGALWEELYTPGTALHAGFLRFWSAVASTFRKAPHVLAFELLNEPSGLCLAGAVCHEAAAAAEVLGSEVEAKRLMPLYQAVAQEIRMAGAAQPILYEPTVLPKVGADVFPAPALGELTQQGLAYHVYCAPGDGGSAAAGLVCKAAQALFEHTYFNFLTKHRGLAGFMTEFGAVGGNAGELAHLNGLLAAADGHLQSWAYWQLKKYADFTTANAAESLYDEEGRLEVRKLAVLSRTYAPIVGGLPLRMAFDPGTAAFELEFNATVAGAPTEVYLNEELHYPNGYTIEVSPEHCLQVSKPETNRIHLFLSEDGACLGHAVRVRLRAGAAPPAALLAV